MTRVQFLAGAVKGFLSFHHHAQTSSQAHPAYYPVGIGVSFPRGKVAGV